MGYFLTINNIVHIHTIPPVGVIHHYNTPEQSVKHYFNFLLDKTFYSTIM